MSARSPFALPVAAFLLLSVAACLPPGESATDNRNQDREELPEEVNLARYEDFDPGPYREEELSSEEEETTEIEHDVPARLLSGQADAGVERTVQGFRVQVLSSKSRDAVEQAAADAEQWWRNNGEGAPEELFSGAEELPVYTVYRQPYYRVRVGDFTSRAQAERALSFLQRRYEDAFIARDEVTVTR